MNVKDVADLIMQKDKEIDKIRSEIIKRGIDKAKAIEEYEKKLAVTIIKLKNGIEMELEGQKIINPPVTLTKDIAKGYCYAEKLNMETADAMYKSVCVNLEAVTAQLSARQSIYRHLDKV
jgi:hypothetical protein